MNDHPIYIYGLTDPRTGRVRYIGKTDNPPERLKNHCNDKSVCHRTNWIRSLIRDGRRPGMVLLQRVPHWARWQDCERMWIEYAILSCWPLTNSTRGGDGTSGLDAESRAKISRAMKGRKLSEAHRLKAIATLQPGRKWTEDEKRARSLARVGIKFSDTHRANISAAKRAVRDEQIAEIMARLGRGESITAVARDFGVSRATISAIKNGRRGYLGGKSS